MLTKFLPQLWDDTSKFSDSASPTGVDREGTIRVRYAPFLRGTMQTTARSRLWEAPTKSEVRDISPA